MARRGRTARRGRKSTTRRGRRSTARRGRRSTARRGRRSTARRGRKSTARRGRKSTARRGRTARRSSRKGASPYNMFVKKMSPILRKQNPGIAQPEIMKLIGKEWKRSHVSM